MLTPVYVLNFRDDLALRYVHRLDIGAALAEIKDSYDNVEKWAKPEKAYALSRKCCVHF